MPYVGSEVGESSGDDEDDDEELVVMDWEQPPLWSSNSQATVVDVGQVRGQQQSLIF